jgi:hypothetical protein
MQACEEPIQVYPEKEFEDALTAIVRGVLQEKTPAAVLRGFGLDIAVFIHDPARPQTVFIEAKSFAGQRQGGVGFGNGRGEGPQVDLLLSTPDALAILDRQVGWAFVDATKPYGASRYALLTCTEALNAAMGTVARGNQNNFGISRLRAHLTDWATFCEDLRFLLEA